VLSTTGSVVGPPSIPAPLDCSGEAAVHYFVGKRQVGFVLAAVQTNCTFSATKTFRRLPVRSRHRHRVRSELLTVVVRFRGNSYLAAAESRAERIRLG
jgi:hypothetical protein